jgi:hypothetical protein
MPKISSQKAGFESSNVATSFALIMAKESLSALSKQRKMFKPSNKNKNKHGGGSDVVDPNQNNTTLYDGDGGSKKKKVIKTPSDSGSKKKKVTKTTRTSKK